MGLRKYVASVNIDIKLKDIMPASLKFNKSVDANKVLLILHSS